MTSGRDDTSGDGREDPPGLHRPRAESGVDISDGRPMVIDDRAGSGRTIDIRMTELEHRPHALNTATAEQSDPELLTMSHVGEYQILDRIGAGGCSSVYAALNEETGEKVALKVLRSGLAGSRRQVLRFQQEAEAVHRIEHPCIVPIYETGALADGRPYMVMELVEGESLTEILYRRGRMSPNEALMILEPVCEALARAHAAGIVHRDIKAGNIMVSGDPEAPVVRLLDFGIAKLLTSETGETVKTSMGRVVGTPQSMAPEQILGHAVTGRTDIYALGILLFRMLTGRHPYASPDAQVVVQMHMTAPPPKTSEFAPTSHGIDDVIARAMAKDPAHRYQSPLDLAGALKQAIQTDLTQAAQTKSALAIYVDARIPPDHELDDTMLDDLMSALDTAEHRLRARGFTIVLETSEAVLGVQLLSGDRAESERRAVLELAEAVRAELEYIAAGRLHFNVCVHQDRALVQPSSHGPVTIAGPITDIGSWAPPTPQRGVWSSFSVDPPPQREESDRT